MHYRKRQVRSPESAGKCPGPSHDWWGEMHEAWFAALDGANQKARTDADFIALQAAYLASIDEDTSLLGLMRDRLADLGVEEEVARQYVSELRIEHPSLEIPF
jgi:hypothetical protein